MLNVMFTMNVRSMLLFWMMFASLYLTMGVELEGYTEPPPRQLGTNGTENGDALVYISLNTSAPLPTTKDLPVSSTTTRASIRRVTYGLGTGVGRWWFPSTTTSRPRSILSGRDYPGRVGVGNWRELSRGQYNPSNQLTTPAAAGVSAAPEFNEQFYQILIDCILAGALLLFIWML